MGIEELETEITNRAETIDFRGTKLKVINVDLVLDLIDQWQTPISTDEGCGMPEGIFVMGDDLPTQPELVEVPKVTGVMINHFKREGFSLHESLNVHVNVPNILSLVYKEFREWLTADDYATKEDIFARAWLDGWVEEKEPTWVVAITDSEAFSGTVQLNPKGEVYRTTYDNLHAVKFTDKTKAEAVALLIGGEAVPVDQEPKLPQEIEVSEYLEEEE